MPWGKQALNIPPGVVKVDSVYAAMGRWVDMNHMRFYRRKPEKQGGWTPYTTALADFTPKISFEGVCRALFPWDDFNFNQYLAIGTEIRCYYTDNTGAVNNITPIRAESTGLSDPFDTTSGSSIILVTDSSHGIDSAGGYVYIDGASAVAGITLAGWYKVVSVPDNNTFTIDAGTNANATTTGGGTVDISYEIDVGSTTTVGGGGWGIGTWGTGTWGEERGSETFLQLPRTWFFDNYGQNLLANYNGGTLYEWDPETPGDPLDAISNAPLAQAFFLTAERYPVMLGADGEMMTIAWPDQADITDWTPDATNTARSRTLQGGSRLVCGTKLVNKLSLIWSDSHLHSLAFIGSTLVYESDVLGENCGIVGPKAFHVVDNTAYWVGGTFELFMCAGGAVQAIPNADDVKDWMIGAMEPTETYKTFARHYPRSSEVAFFFVPAGEEEPRAYVMVNLRDWSWSHGLLPMARSAAAFQKTGLKRLFMAGTDGIVYQHEVGVNAINGLDDEQTTSAIDAYITAAPVELNMGQQVLDMEAFIPDFQRHTGSVDIELVGYDYPMKTTPVWSETRAIAPGDGIVDTFMEGRQISFTLRSFVLDGDFRLGLPRVSIADNGER